MRRIFTTLILAVAGLLIAAGSASATPNLLTPAGLNPGDKFRFIAVTSGSTTATSTDINTYNTFVQNDFGGATYNGVVVNWKAIGSTFTVNARDYVGGFGTTVPVFKPFTGTLVATGLGDTYNPGGNIYGLWTFIYCFLAIRAGRNVDWNSLWQSVDRIRAGREERFFRVAWRHGRVPRTDVSISDRLPMAEQYRWAQFQSSRNVRPLR
ncbi:MAG: hypothetical protein FJ275_03275 [Planctomycetes bacterium]|nr:hypothetical protein [Planctomycetota bacterium]